MTCFPETASGRSTQLRRRARCIASGARAFIAARLVRGRLDARAQRELVHAGGAFRAVEVGLELDLDALDAFRVA